MENKNTIEEADSFYLKPENYTPINGDFRRHDLYEIMVDYANHVQGLKKDSSYCEWLGSLSSAFWFPNCIKETNNPRVFIRSDLKSIDFHYCPYCGKKINEVVK
jgi:hypothetical protein